jgi:hypothetical protein
MHKTELRNPVSLRNILSVSIGLVRLIVFTVWVLPITHQVTSCTTGGRTSRISFPGSTWERETEALPQGTRCESKEPRDNAKIIDCRAPTPRFMLTQITFVSLKNLRLGTSDRSKKPGFSVLVSC